MNVIKIQYIRLVIYQVVLGNVSPKERIKQSKLNTRGPWVKSLI